MKEIVVKLHKIEDDGYPDMENMVGRVAFIFDGCVVSGWPLDGDGGEYDAQYDEGGFLAWEGNSDMARPVSFHNVRYWVEFPVPVSVLCAEGDLDLFTGVSA